MVKNIKFKKLNGEWILTDEESVYFSWDIDYTHGICGGERWDKLPNGELLENPDIIEINEREVVLVYFAEDGEKRKVRIRAPRVSLSSSSERSWEWESSSIDIYPAEGRIEWESSDEEEEKEDVLSRFFAEEAREELLKKFL